MAKTASLNIRIDPETKKGAEELFAAFGITVTDAVNMFLRQSLMEGGLPFELKQPRYNAETEAAMRECDEMLAGGNYKRYNSYADLEADILAEMEAEDGDKV
ncbi:MAG: type II toxin-antitoxin system RelB/DinJ family antitoxin [Clostridium sp.]|jgi:DNA-damage-inducible protein J|nr:type II toxin-antitoxin system RelB/DinJ family antitoxin [Clostridium sp.]